MRKYTKPEPARWTSLELRVRRDHTHTLTWSVIHVIDRGLRSERAQLVAAGSLPCLPGSRESRAGRHALSAALGAYELWVEQTDETP